MKETEFIEQQTNAIVLESKDIIHGNRYITLLTQKYGVINAYANGAKNPKGKLSGVTQPLIYGKYILVRKRDLYSVHNGHLLHQFSKLHSNMDSFFLALYFAQLMAFISPKADRSEECLKLLLNTLDYLEKGILQIAQIKAIYELRLLSICGYMPDLVACSECGKYEDPIMFFYPREANLKCSSCSPAAGGLFLEPALLRALRHIVFSPAERLFRFTLSKEDLLKKLENISEIYVFEQMGSSFKALDFYKKMMNKPY